MAIQFLDPQPGQGGVQYIDPPVEPEQVSEPPGRNPLLAPLIDIGRTIKAIAVGPDEEYKADFERGARRIAQFLPVRSSMNAAMGLGDTTADFAAAAAQRAAGAAGLEETAKDVQAFRRRSSQASDRWRQWNAEQNEDSVVGPYWADILMGAQENITESVGVGGIGGGLKAISSYYAVKAMQQSIREHPDRPGLAIAHGFIDGATTQFIGGRLNATMAGLPSRVRSAVSPIIGRAMGRATAKVPSGAFTNALAGVPAEVIEEVVAENGHYFSDVMAGVEEFDGATYARRLRDAAVAAGVTAGTAESMMGAAQIVADRQSSFESALTEELAAAETELFGQAQEGDLPARMESLAEAEREAVEKYGDKPGDVNELERRVEKLAADVAARPEGASPEQVAEARRQLYAAREAKAPKTADDVQRVEAELEAGQADEALEADRAEAVARFAQTGQADPQQPAAAVPRSRAQSRIDGQQKKLATARAEVAALDAARIEGLPDLTEQKDIALKAINAALPPSKRLQLMTKAAGVRSKGGMKQFLAQARKTLERHNKKLAVDSVKAAIKNAEKYSTDPETRQAVEQVVSKVDLGSARSRKQLESLREYLAENPEMGTPPGFTEALERLNQKHIGQHTPAELRELAAAIDNIAGERAKMNQLISINRDMTVASLAEQIKGEIAVNKPRQAGLLAAAGSASANALMRPEDVANGLSSEIAKLGWENIGVEGYRNELRLKHSVMGEMRTLMRSLGLSPDRTLKATGRGGTALNLWRNEARSIGGRSMTRGEALHLYMLSLDPEARARLLEHGATLHRGVKDRVLGRQRGMVSISEATFREIGDFIGPQGKQLAEHAFMKINTTLRDAANKAWVDVHGVPLSERTDYFPISLDKDFVAESKDAESFFNNFRQFTLESYSILKQREGSDAPLSVRDGLDVYGRHVSVVSRVAAYLAPTRDFYAVMKRADVKDAVVSATSNPTYEGVLDAVSQQVLPVSDSTLWSRVPRKIVRGAGASILGLRFTTPFYNVNSAVAGASLLPNGENLYLQAARDVASPDALSAIEQKAARLSPYWTERFDNFVRESTSGLIGENSFFQPAGIDSAALKHIEVVDKAGSIVRWRAVELHVQQNLGVDPADPAYEGTVAREWERLTYRTESTSHGLEANGAIRAGRRHGMVAPFMQFESGASKMRSLLMRSKNDMAKGNYKQARRAAAAWGANAILTSIIGALAAFARDSDDEELFIDRLGQTAAREGGPIIGDLARQAYRAARGMQTYTGPNDTLSDVVFETQEGGILLAGALGQYISGELNDEGHPKYRETIVQGIGKMQALVGAMTKIPIEGGLDTAGMIGNMAGLTDAAADQEIANLLAGLREEKDIGDGRARVWNALMTDDDSQFLRGLKDIYTKDPSRLTASTLRGVVNGKFSQLRQFERNPELIGQLSDDGRKWLVEMQTQRDRMFQALQEMVERNSGQIDAITR